MRAPAIPAGTRLHVLTGPTAVGKTEWALRWAEKHDAEIISADSLLFYRGMDIGTAKPTEEERQRVPHHLIDVTRVDQPWDIRRYVEAAAGAVAQIASRGKKILVAGGSGFYLKSYWAPVTDQWPIPPEVRDRVRLMLDAGPGIMLEELRKLNPDGLGDLDCHNSRRVAKALERCLASGLSLKELKGRMTVSDFPCKGLPVNIVLLERDEGELRQRIARRADSMLAGGLVEEVERLLDLGLATNPSASSAIGYRETIRYLRGEINRDTLRSEIILHTHQLVRKQRTWFRNQLPEHKVRDADMAAPDWFGLFAGP